MKTCPLCDTSFPNHHTACPTDGAMLIESRDLEPGTVVRNKYRIVRTLGRGGMGTVYLAEHILLGRQRALKFMSAELSQDAKFLKRFRLEALATIELHHQNIVGVVDLDQAEDGSPFIAMEYVEGQSLRDALADAPFPVERALSIARGIGLGLIVAHSQNLIHRDIKPENILLAQEAGKPEVPKILDFGIAAMRQSSTAISRTRGILLTPEYAAPEQWKGLPAEELDGRVDLYALGGVLHEMLTGSTSLHAHNTEGWMYQHLQITPETPSRLHPELARWIGLDELVLRLLEKERDQRTASAEQFVRELDAVRSGTPISSRAKATPEVSVPSAPVQPEAQVVLPPTMPAVSHPAPAAPETGFFTGVEQSLRELGAAPSGPATSSPAKPAVAVPQILAQSAERVSTQVIAPAPSQPAPVARKESNFFTKFIGAVIVLAVFAAAGWFWFQDSKTQDRKKGLDLFDADRFDEALPLLKSASENGDAVCTYDVGWMYENGKGVAQDIAQAVPWYRKAAALGEPHAESKLGWLYASGTGVAQDDTQAVYWYRKAADQGLASGESNLGLMYEYGHGVAKDYAQALYWYRKAADQGDANGESNLGIMYQLGQGVALDYAQAEYWYRKAADQGNALGEVALGDLYRHGHGVTQDYTQAVFWYRKAAEQGDDEAMNDLGVMCEYGKGVEKDLNQAISLYRKSAALGNDEAKQNLQRLGQQ
jgi:TPR repeat protein/serine/threonine protein kinase